MVWNVLAVVLMVVVVMLVPVPVVPYAVKDVLVALVLVAVMLLLTNAVGFSCVVCGLECGWGCLMVVVLVMLVTLPVVPYAVKDVLVALVLVAVMCCSHMPWWLQWCLQLWS